MFERTIQQAATQWGVPESWIKAVIETESNWNPLAHNSSDPGGGAFGLGQILVSTARNLGYTGTPEGLYDPATNIDLIAHLLSQLRTQYGTDFRRIYSAYNSGNPSLWQTSEEVAANVSRALAALLKYEGPGITAVVLGFLLIWIFKKRK